MRRVHLSFYSPFSWKTHGKTKMTHLIFFFSLSDQGRQTFSLQSFLSLCLRLIFLKKRKKNPLPACMVLTNWFFFNISQCYHISVIAVNIQIKPPPLEESCWLFIVKLSYKNWAPNGSEYCKYWRTFLTCARQCPSGKSW